MISGGESVGIILEGERFRSRYVYTQLKIEELQAIPDDHSTPTVFQVSVSLLAALSYILQHPQEGILYPEDLDPEKILTYVTPDLSVYSKEL